MAVISENIAMFEKIDIYRLQLYFGTLYQHAPIQGGQASWRYEIENYRKNPQTTLSSLKAISMPHMPWKQPKNTDSEKSI